MDLNKAEEKIEKVFNFSEDVDMHLIKRGQYLRARFYYEGEMQLNLSYPKLKTLAQEGLIVGSVHFDEDCEGSITFRPFEIEEREKTYTEHVLMPQDF